jgi:hypothetical protein
MGYLDHSTNNIILDAVLTDYGRSKLASAGTNQGGGFKISKFAFGDDEIDYTIIKKYGRTVGKEKIEKNTPIFEALTNESIALKYKLIGLSNSGAPLQTTRLPVISSTDTLSLNNTTSSGAATITLRYKGTTANDTDLARDFGSTSSLPGSTSAGKKYAVTLSSRFLTLSGVTTSSAPLNDANRTKTYTYTSQSNSFDLTFAVNTIDNTTLQVYGKKNGTSYTITTYVTVECLDVPAISKTFSVTYTASA